MLRILWIGVRVGGMVGVIIVGRSLIHFSVNKSRTIKFMKQTIIYCNLIRQCQDCPIWLRKRKIVVYKHN